MTDSNIQQATANFKTHSDQNGLEALANTQLFNREAEQVVLGCGICDPSKVMPQLTKQLAPKSFYLRQHRIIFHRLTELFEQRQPIDLITLGNRLAENGELDDIGGRAYLSEILGKVMTTTSVGYYCEIINDKVFKRDLNQVLSEAAERALEDPHAALEQISTQLQVESVSRAAKERQSEASALSTFPDAAYIGLGADFANLFAQAVESPKSFLYTSFLTCLGALIGDRVALSAATRNPARLFTVLLGPSGSARKSTAIKLTVDFFTRAVEGFPIVRGIASAEGLAGTIKKRDYTNCLLSLDELRAFVDKAKIEGSVLLSLVNSLFEDSYAESHTKGHDMEIENVHLSLLSACTLDTFGNIFNKHFIGIGFPNRLFLVLDDAKDRKAVPGDVSRDAESSILERLGSILDALDGYSPERPLLISLNPEATKLWGEFYDTIPRTMSGIRLDQIGLRLAMLLAVSSGKFEIDAEVIRATIEICRWQLSVRDEVLPIEANNAIAEMEEKIRRNLKARGPLRERQLKSLTNANRAGLWVFEAAKSNLGRAKEIIFDPRNRVWLLLDEETPNVVGPVVTSENGCFN